MSHVVGRLALVGLCVACLVAVAVVAAAQIPQKLNYQVMLTDDLSQPLADQTVEMVFTVYDAESGGTALWTETQNVMTNSIGVVSALMGDVNPIDFELSGPIWLEVDVNGETLSPRRELATAPFAAWSATASDAAALGGIDAGEYALLTDIGGDGHSLDADDGDPVDALYVDSEGWVGVGTTSPQAEFHLAGGPLQVGSYDHTGSVHVYLNGGAEPVVSLGSLYTSGRLALRDVSGTEIGAFGPSFYGGGYLQVNGANGSIQAVGNDAFTGSPSLGINGAASAMSFNSGYAGDTSVELPDNAISADEIEAEPGVASAQSDTIIDLPRDVIYTVAERSITVPDFGFVYVMGTAQVDFDNFYVPSGHHAHFGVSEITDAFSSHAQESSVMLWDGAPVGYYDYHVAVSGLFEVTPGSHTFYLNARENDGFCYVTATQLTLMYFPTAYGTVDTDD